MMMQPTTTTSSSLPMLSSSENIKIFVRIRPLSELEGSSSSLQCLSVEGASSIIVRHPSIGITGGRLEQQSFDFVGGPTTSQEEIFNLIGRHMTEYCLQGYNATIFAYGQTGSGKTYTMLGPVASEITNALREDVIKKNIFVEGALEKRATNAQEALNILATGARNRTVGATALNRESSRSHSVFTLYIQSRTLDQNTGLTDVRDSRFNLVDLAGSERQSLAQTSGTRLREAGAINKSLLALANVMNGLVASNPADGLSLKPQKQHISYRDSKLTFLLKDSLGGNAKTMIIANVSPALSSYSETVSTLRFAQRAKLVKNNAVVNHDVLGNVGALQAEIARLKEALSLRKSEYNPVDGLNSRDGGGIIDPIAQKARILLHLRDQNSELRSKLELLEDLLLKKDQQLQNEKMITRFREAEIAQLKKNHTCLEPEEVQRIQAELIPLQRALKNNTDISRLLYENSQLSTRLAALESFSTGLDEYLAKEQERAAMAIQALETEDTSQDDLQSQIEMRDLEIERLEDIIATLADEKDPPTKKFARSQELGSDNDQMNIVGGVATASGETFTDRQQTFLDTEREKVLHQQLEKIAQLSQENDSLKKELFTQDERVRQAEETASIFKARASAAENEKTNFVERCNLLEEKLFNSEATAGILNSQLSKLDFEISTLNSRYLVSESERRELRDKNSEMADTLTHAQNEVRSLAKEKSSLECLLDEKNQLITELKSSVYDLVQRNTQLSGSIDAQNASIDELHIKVVTAENLVQSLQTEVQICRTCIEDKTKSAEVVKCQLEGLLAEKEQELQRAHLGISEFELALTRCKEEKAQYLGDIEALSHRLASITTQNSCFASEKEMMSLKIANLEAERLAQTEIQQKTVGLLNEANVEMDHLLAAFESTQKEAKTLKEEVAKLARENQSLLQMEEERKTAALNIEMAHSLLIAELTDCKKEIERLRCEMAVLREENDKLVQHQNAKQKLQYHVKIKQENNDLKEEIRLLQEELIRLTQQHKGA